MTQKPNGRLLPCPNPWCTSGTPPLPAALKREGWRVICACGVQTFRQETEAEAIRAWNTRVPAVRRVPMDTRATQEAINAIGEALRSKP